MCVPNHPTCGSRGGTNLLPFFLSLAHFFVALLHFFGVQFQRLS